MMPVWSKGYVVSIIHDGMSPFYFVIPGLTKPAPYLIRGNPVFSWIPAGVHPDSPYLYLQTILRSP